MKTTRSAVYGQAADKPRQVLFQPPRNAVTLREAFVF
jgi:hypothetical protein